MKAIETLNKLKPALSSSVDVSSLKAKCYEAMDDDLNSPILLSHIFEGVRYINAANDGSERLSSGDIEMMKGLFKTFVSDVLGLKDEEAGKADDLLADNLMKIIIDLRQDAKNRKEWGLSDKIREELKKAGIILKDLKDGAEWEKI
jgi:cysteinyl-tRNA synthetase